MAVGCLVKKQVTTNRVQTKDGKACENSLEKTRAKMSWGLRLGAEESGRKQGHQANVIEPENISRYSQNCSL